MHLAGRPKICSEFHPATSWYGAHMGTCYHSPSRAEAWLQGQRDRAVFVDCGDMEPHQAVAKAIALVR